MKTLLEFLVNKPIVNPNNKFVDLGLPSGTLWAACNLGAKKPEETGDYYAWGEIETKMKYGDKDYKFVDKNDPYIFTKYNDNDNKKILDDNDNAVIKKLGKNYDMPTAEQLDELLINCDWEVDNNKKCLKLISKYNKNILILPLGGFCGNAGSKRIGEVGRYWSKTLVNDDEDYGQALRIFTPTSTQLINIDDTARHLGCNIRPIKK